MSCALRQKPPTRLALTLAAVAIIAVGIASAPKVHT